MASGDHNAAKPQPKNLVSHGKIVPLAALPGAKLLKSLINIYCFSSNASYLTYSYTPNTPTHLRVGAKPLRRPVQISKACPGGSWDLAAGGMFFFVLLGDQRERVVKLFNRFSSWPSCTPW